MDTIADAARLLATAQRVVILTGAGISTESGIPDFRGPNGVWTKNPAAEKASTLSHYVSDPEVRVAAWRTRLESPMWAAEPNAGHRALVELADVVPVTMLVTQNIDGLHTRAGWPTDRLIEIHGTVHEVVCLSCNWRAPMQVALDRVTAGEDDPHCLECGGILKSATISFGQNLIAEDLVAAQAAAEQADVFIALGTSLGVYPAAALPELALRRGARLIVANAEATPFDEVADVVLRDPLGTVLPSLVAEIRSVVGNTRPTQ